MSGDFYSQQGIKKLPDNFQECLDPIVLAIWFLDDGGRSSGVKTGVFLTLDRYTLNEIEIIQQTLKIRFGIQTHFHTSGKSQSGLIQKRLSITGKNYDSFYQVVAPVINHRLQKSSISNGECPPVLSFLIPGFLKSCLKFNHLL